MPETGVVVPSIDSVAPIVNVVGTAVGAGEAVRFVTDEITGSKRSLLRRVVPWGKKQQANNPGQKPHPFAPAKTAPVEATGPTVRFATHQFKDTLSNMPAISESGKERIPGVTPAEYVEFSKELVDGMRGFAESYVQKLINMNRITQIGGRRVNLYVEMKRVQVEMGQSYAEDDYMLDLFAPVDAQTGLRKLKSAAEINELISAHPEVIQNLMVVAERYARDVFAAAGVRAEMRGEGRRRSSDAPQSFDFPIDQGPLNVAVRSLVNWLDTPTNQGGRGGPGLKRWQAIVGTSASGAGLGAGTGVFVAGPVGALAGGAAGVALGPVVITAIKRLTQNGVRLTMVRDQGVLNAANRNGEWMRGVILLGIDSRDRNRSTNRELALQQAAQIVYLRAEYMRNLGVPPQQLDALSEQFLNVSDQRPEETGETMRNETIMRFRELGGWGLNIGPMQQREIYRRAQEQAMAHRFELLIARGQRQTVDEAARLQQAKAARQVGEGGAEGAILVARKREATEIKQRLTEDRSTLETRGGALTAYQQKLEAARAAEQELNDFISEISRTLPPGAPAGARTTPRNFEEAIDWLRATINIPGTYPTMVPGENGRLVAVTSLANKAVADAGLKAGEIAAIPIPPGGPIDEAYRARVAGVNRKYEPIEQELTDLRNLVQGAIRRLQNLDRTATQARQEALSSPETTTASRTQEEFERAKARLAPAIAAAGPDYLAIRQQANALGIWPPEDNDLPENRLLIRQVLIQHRANQEIHNPANVANVPVLEAAYNSFVSPHTPGDPRFTPEQLRALSIEELEHRASRPGIAPRPRLDFENAKSWAELNVEYLQRAIQEENRLIQEQEAVQDRAIRRVNPENEIAQLEMVEAMNNDIDQIQARAIQAWLDPTKRARLEDSAILTAAASAEGYIAAEISSHIPRNVLEILQILTGYQDNPDRASKFQEITRNIDMTTTFLNMLNKVFRDSLGYPPLAAHAIPAGATRLQIFAIYFGNSSRANSINGVTFGRTMTRSLIAEFNAWSRTI